VQDHEVGGHLRGNFDLLGFEFCVHTKENIMCSPIVPWKIGSRVTLLQRMDLRPLVAQVNLLTVLLAVL
jgi:hypothetical protein